MELFISITEGDYLLIREDGWKRHKSNINKRYGQIRVRISNLKIRLISPERATVHFEQDYSSDKYYDRGRKTIQLIKRDGKWKIMIVRSSFSLERLLISFSLSL